jgi:FecR protein
MKRLIFVLYLFAWHLAALRAEPFQEAEVTKAINLVSLLPPDKPAVRGDVVRGNTGLKTEGDSRAELQFPDLTITRVGSNSLFRFVAGTREIVLDSGTLLFSAPEGAGGGKVSAGAITAAVTGSDFLISLAVTGVTLRIAVTGVTLRIAAIPGTTGIRATVGTTGILVIAAT